MTDKHIVTVIDSTPVVHVLHEAESVSAQHPGLPGTPGTNATVTADSIAAALGGAPVIDSDPRLGDAREWHAETVTQSEAAAGSSTARAAWTAQRVFDAIAGWWAGSAAASKLAGIQSGAQVNAVLSVAGRLGDVVLGKSDVGLGNVDNTSDADKPLSQAAVSALDGKQDTLLSGTTIKTVGGHGLMGAGDVNPVTTASVNAAMSGQTMTAGSVATTDYYAVRGRNRSAQPGFGALGAVMAVMHPEDADSVIIPYHSNDLAYLTLRGGTAEQVSGPLALGYSGIDRLLDCSPLHLRWFPRPTEPVVIELILPAPLLYSSIVGYSVRTGFHPRYAKIEWRNAVTGVWSLASEQSGLATGQYAIAISAPSAQGFDGLRYTFDDAQSSTQLRMSQIFVVNYASDLGRSVYVARDNSAIFGKLVVGANVANPATAATTLAVAGDLGPHVAGVGNCGVPARPWAQVYANDGAIQTSDARLKTPVRALTQAERDCARALVGQIGIYKWLGSVERKGDAARQHVGVTVQTVIATMAAHGLDAMQYGIVCYDAWPARHETIPAVIDEDTGTEVEPERTELIEPAGDRYSLRYDQLTLFCLAALASSAEV